MLGWLQSRGLGIEQDEAKAAESFEQASQLGSAVGTFYTARHLSKFEKHSEAFALYRKASQMGHLPSVFWVGYCAAKGQGTERNYDSAYRYLETAALRGHVYAVRELALLDIRGLRGLSWRLLAPLEFVVGLLGAVLLSIFAPDSDRIRA
jgi:uncharacterized protein